MKLYELKEEGILYMMGWRMRTRVIINLSRCHLLVPKGKGEGWGYIIVLGDIHSYTMQQMAPVFVTSNERVVP